MLSLLASGVKYLWDISTKSSVEVNKPDEEEDEIPLREWGELEAKKEKQTGKEVKGEVTSLHSGYGLVDGYIYFDFKVVDGGFRPEVGTKVIVNTICNDDGGWIATKLVTIESSVSFQEDWGNETESLAIAKDRYETNEVGKVTYFDNKQGGYINNFLKFELETVKEGFIPCVGDWVVANLLRSESRMLEKVIGVSPLQTRKCEGRIAQINEDFGVIDREIYFRPNCINENSGFRLGDRVNATIIESNFKNFLWRAIYIVKMQTMKERDNQKQNSVISIPLQNLLTDKNGISITQDLDFGYCEIGKQSLINILMRNHGENDQVLLSFKLESSANEQFKVRSIYKDLFILPLVLSPGEEAGFVAECIPCVLGKSSQLLTFNFEGFTIGRILTANTYFSKQNSPGGASKTPFRMIKHKSSFSAIDDDNFLIPGQKPKHNKNWKRNYSAFFQYRVPKELWECVINKINVIKLEPVLAEPLTEINYKRRFETLLHLEEIALELEMGQYSMEEVTLQRHNCFLTLEVPGLSEKRPSLIIGDFVIIEYSNKPKSNNPSVRYEGCIHEINETTIHLMFHPKFHESYSNELVTVHFKLNRTSLRRCHQSVQLSDLLGNNVLFPREICTKPPMVECRIELPCELCSTTSTNHDSRKRRVTVVDRLFSASPNAIKTTPETGSIKCTCSDKNSSSLNIKWFNENLNDRQKVAVHRILRGETRPMPYVIFGPPGTGKTVTVVEAVLQVLRLCENSRVLVCTPSNSAADLLAERFHLSGKLIPGAMIRINAMQRGEKNIPECILNYCSITTDVDVQAHYRLIISTCSTAAVFRNLNLADQHFTHVFVDEAGQATEPECLIPLLYCGPDGQIILAGDPYQLGAVIHSKIGLNCSFSLSFLERLMQRHLYARDVEKYPTDFYNPLLVTKLVNNYRSHYALLTTASELFYENELVPKVDSAEFENLLSFNFLPKKGFPLIFHGLQGETLREGNNPSWFNPVEVVQVIRYICSLYKENISQNDIGVVTPYRKQVEKIRLMMDSLEMEKPKIGSTEEFQGQERLVIIISTVRSGNDCFSSDGNGLGFLKNKKRFNVAVTRPKGLLIVVGDPFLLSEDPCWRKLLNYSIENGAYLGCDLPIGSTKCELMSDIKNGH